MTVPVGLRQAACLSMLLAATIVAAGPDVSLESDTALATAGYYQLRWNTPAAGVRLVESASAGFDAGEIIYEGLDTAHLVSGKPDGDYFYRLESVRSPPGQEAGIISNTIQVTVQHHPLERAMLFFGIGAVVFVATLGLVVFGGRVAGGRA